MIVVMYYPVYNVYRNIVHICILICCITFMIIIIWDRIWEKGPIANFSHHKICCELWYVSSQI